MNTAQGTDMRALLDTDFVWTPRQREVLDRITQGKSNQQIADELGISLDGAKWHMREVLSKLNVETREDAAEYWRLYNGWRPRLARAFRGIAHATALKWVAASGAVVVLGLGALAVYAAFSGDEERQAGEPVEESPTATSTAATSTPAPPPSPVPTPVGHSTDARTGIPEVDRVIEAVLAADSSRIAELMVWEDRVCTAEPPTQIGGPPQCPPGVPGGSTIETFGHGSCEGSRVLRGEEADTLGTMSRTGQQLYAVWATSESEVGIEGVTHAALFASPGDARMPWVGFTYFVSLEGIVYFNGGCADSPAERVDLMGVTSFVLPPPR